MSSANGWNGKQALADVLNDSTDEIGSVPKVQDTDMTNYNKSVHHTSDSTANSSNKNNVDFYQLLGVSRQATKEEIKLAYRKKARTTHPDRNKTVSQAEAERAFHDLTFAYKTLIDDRLRGMYDQFGKKAIDGKLKIDITKINVMGLFDQ